MYRLETIVRAYAGSSPDCDITISLDDAREAIEQYKAARTALRRIASLEEKNVSKYAQQIAKEGLRASHVPVLRNLWPKRA